MPVDACRQESGQVRPWPASHASTARVGKDFALKRAVQVRRLVGVSVGQTPDCPLAGLSRGHDRGECRNADVRAAAAEPQYNR